MSRLDEDEKRAFDALMDGLDSDSDESSDGSFQAQGKVSHSPDIPARFRSSSGSGGGPDYTSDSKGGMGIGSPAFIEHQRDQSKHAPGSYMGTAGTGGDRGPYFDNDDGNGDGSGMISPEIMPEIIVSEAKQHRFDNASTGSRCRSGSGASQSQHQQPLHPVYTRAPESAPPKPGRIKSTNMHEHEHGGGGGGGAKDSYSPGSRYSAQVVELTQESGTGKGTGSLSSLYPYSGAHLDRNGAVHTNLNSSLSTSTSTSNRSNTSSTSSGIRSPEFRGRYKQNNASSFDSEDEDEDEIDGIGGKHSKFRLRLSSEDIGSRMQQQQSASGSVRNSRDGPINSNRRSAIGLSSSAAAGPSSSDKERLSEIDSFGTGPGTGTSAVEFGNGNMGIGIGMGMGGGDGRSSTPTCATHTGTGTCSSSSTSTDTDDGTDSTARGTTTASAVTAGGGGGTSNASNLEATKKWLLRPCTKNARVLQCYVERDRSGFTSMHPTFRMYNEQNNHTGSCARFMMSAKKLSGKGSSYYLISLDINPDDDRGSDSVIGRVRGNGVGSEYLFTDAGIVANKTRLTSTIRKEMGYIRFNFDSNGPSSTTVWIPQVTASGKASVWQPEDDAHGMENYIQEGNKCGPTQLMEFQNKKPRYDTTHGGHVLNFKGRVTESSVKNFQLTCISLESEEDREDVLLQFGKVAKNKFTLDFSWPLSPLQAFGICIASLDGKLADRKGYEFVRKSANFLFGSK